MAGLGSTVIFLVCVVIGIILQSESCFAGHPATSLTWTAHYTQEGRLLERMYNSSGQLYKCQVYGDRLSAERVLIMIPRENQFLVDRDRFHALVERCSAMDPHMTRSVRRKRFIFPGTKWCGAGDIAKSYGDLGTHKSTDRCCRAHDHCSISISAKKTKYGVYNDGEYSVSACVCDKTFYACLKDANSDASNIVHFIYFNVVSLKCLDIKHPQSCTGYWFWKKCSPNYSVPKKWTLVDFNKDYQYVYLLQ
ncbi:phospholipase A(2)-like [Liolophura sinensis]|uniref:phospholipase A(2)-like n=1 Tax=Liolophura sinensis TaxID=3198878 RepID=UPI0031596A50